MAHEPIHTYLFDDFQKAEHLENLLDKMYFYSDLKLGISMHDFVVRAKTLSSIFVPVASFHDENAKNSNEESVALIEGVVYPWFGIGYRIDRIQFNLDDEAMLERLDQAKETI